MSGGYWNYLAEPLKDASLIVSNTMSLVAEIEHEMDWGYSSDTCRACAKLRTIAALEAYFDDGARTTSKALAVLRDRQQNRCERDSS